MIEWIGKACRIHINKAGVNLYFTSQRVIAINETHLTFIDRKGVTYSFKLSDIAQISEIT
jgi:hypothetical protein